LKKNVEIKILGQSYLIKTDTSDEYLQKIAGFIDAQMKEILKTTAGISSTNLAVLAALNIADLYFKLKEEKENLEVSSLKLAEMIEKELQKDKVSPAVFVNE